VVHNNIEFSVQECEAGIWRWEYTIGELIKSGELVVSTRVVASRKVRQQIDRDLRSLYRSQRERGIRFWIIFQLWARSANHDVVAFSGRIPNPGFDRSIPGCFLWSVAGTRQCYSHWDVRFWNGSRGWWKRLPADRSWLPDQRLLKVEPAGARGRVFIVNRS
jgi:hypothetical protein